MRKILTKIFTGILLISVVTVTCVAQKEAARQKLLLNDWWLKSSVLVSEDGSRISTADYKPQDWLTTSVPATVLSTLVRNGIYPDPRTGLNLFKIPDSSDEFNNKNDLNKFSYLPDKRNPWRDPYWYRAEFSLTEVIKGQHAWLNFNCINYRADVWLNGSLITNKEVMAGMFQRFRFDITGHVRKGPNILAVLIYPVDHPGEPDTQLEVFGKPRGFHKEIMKDVTEVMSVGYDCFPTVPDRNMGIIQEVYIDYTGPVDIRNPFIITDLPLPETDHAKLTISAEVFNATASYQKGVINGTIAEGNIEFRKDVELGPGETKVIVLSCEEFPQMAIDNPRLWWPVNYGEQNLYNLSLSFNAKGKVSDQENVTFGIREITKELYKLDGAHGLRLHINGKKIFCRGGYIQPEMMFDWNLRTIETEIRYLTGANLNWVCFEDIPNPPDALLELCDRYGLMFWNNFYGCYWLQPGTDYPSDIDLLERCTIDLIKRYRNHPSLVLYMSMNEGETREEVYTMWRKHIIQLDGTRLFIPSGSFPDYRKDLPEWIKQDTPVGMNDYPPSSANWEGHSIRTEAIQPPPETYYKWVLEERSWMFKMESYAASLPPVSSLKKFIPDLGLTFEGDPYPLSKTWAHHGANSYYKPYDEMLRKRYGSPTSVNDYCRKGHLLTAEQHRAMFEAVNHKMWDITSGFGVWKLNSGWPSVQWQIYDWYLRPMVSYYYIRKANAPLVVQLSPVDSTVTIVNNSFKKREDLEVSAKIYDFASRMRWGKTIKTNIESNTYKDIFTLESLDDLTPVYFVRLELKDSNGKLVSDNFYWFSSGKPADFTDLGKLPSVKLNVSLSYEIGGKGEEIIVHLKVENPTDKLAFFVHFLLTRSSDGEEVLPVFWEDNYFSLAPGEKRELKAVIEKKDLNGAVPVIEVEGWNIQNDSYR